MSDLTLVTGASSNHFDCLKHLLYSIALFEPWTRIIVFDLGLTPAEHSELQQAGVELRRFPFAQHPPHLNIQINRGEYAWKPVIIADLLAETKAAVLWLDAGNLLHQGLDRIRKILATHGLFIPATGATIKRWTHAKTLEYLDAASLGAKSLRDASIVGFHPQIRGITGLAERWKACALDLNCIAPPGSDRSNHRQDQSVLSILVWQFQQQHGCKLIDHYRPEFSRHNDHRSLEQIRQMLGQPPLANPA